MDMLQDQASFQFGNSRHLRQVLKFYKLVINYKIDTSYKIKKNEIILLLLYFNRFIWKTSN